MGILSSYIKIKIFKLFSSTPKWLKSFSFVTAMTIQTITHESTISSSNKK